MWDSDEVIAILLSDIHLSYEAPIWRSAEPYWFEAMKRPLDEVRAIQKECNCPVISAGDIFEWWYAAKGKRAPELINFALEFLPDKMICIPGQHDLPNHNYNLLKQSAYWTLVKADKIKNLSPFTHKDFSYSIDNMILYGFPYGCQIQPLIKSDKNKIHIAVAHQYVWINKCSYPKAPFKSKIRGKRKEWKGYDVIVFGDNHKGFTVYYNGHLTVINCGALMKRKSDEVVYKPQIGLLLNTGEVKVHYLDTSKDKYLDTRDMTEPKEIIDMKQLLQELEKLDDSALDFPDAIQQFFHRKKVTPKVREIIIDMMENRRG